MKTFIVKRNGEILYIESVSDCDSLEQFVNRHFGSVDPNKCNLTVLEQESTTVAEEPVKDTKAK